MLFAIQIIVSTGLLIVLYSDLLPFVVSNFAIGAMPIPDEEFCAPSVRLAL